MTDLEKWQEFEKNNPPKTTRVKTRRNNRYSKEEEERLRQERIRQWEEEKTDERRKREDIEDYYGTVYEIKNGVCEYCNKIQEIKWNGKDWVWSRSETGLARYSDNGECILLENWNNEWGYGIYAIMKVNYCPICGRKL